MASQYPIMDKTKIVHSIMPATLTGTTTGDTVDTLGFDGVGFCFMLGDATTASVGNTFTITWEEGDASNMSDKATITTNKTAIQGTLAVIAATTGDEITYTWNYTGGKRYVRCVATEAGTASIDCAAFVILSTPRVAPVSN